MEDPEDQLEFHSSKKFHKENVLGNVGKNKVRGHKWNILKTN